MSRLLLKTLFNPCMFAVKNERLEVWWLGVGKKPKKKKKSVFAYVCLNYILDFKNYLNHKYNLISLKNC